MPPARVKRGLEKDLNMTIPFVFFGDKKELETGISIAR
jgi:hypothetical protein